MYNCRLFLKSFIEIRETQFEKVDNTRIVFELPKQFSHIVSALIYVTGCNVLTEDSIHFGLPSLLFGLEFIDVANYE